MTQDPEKRVAVNFNKNQIKQLVRACSARLKIFRGAPQSVKASNRRNSLRRVHKVAAIMEAEVMRVGFKSYHKSSDTPEGKVVSGGTAHGNGFFIAWQDGPLGRDEDRVAPNGAFVEDIIDVCRDRLMAFQSSRLACPENQAAINALSAALAVLEDRTKAREDRGVEGTYRS